MHIRNLTCTVGRKHQTSETQLCLEQADGQYSHGCSVFIDTALLGCFCALVHQKVSFIILLLRLGLVLGLRLVRWRGSATGKALDFVISRSWFQILFGATMRNNLGQVVYTYVPLSPSSITWYRPKGGDALRLGR